MEKNTSCQLFSQLFAEWPAFDGHEQLLFGHDEAAGLSCIIAVHHTGLGPALGGLRMYPYSSLDMAVHDVLRLSRGMSYKNAMAGLPLGGGKAVIIGDPAIHKTPALFQAFGRQVEALGGRYMTAEDVGITVDDISEVSKTTRFTAGRAQKDSVTASGDPSPMTALGVFYGMQAALRHNYGVNSFVGRSVAIQGLGHVGSNLAKLLHEAGAELVVADVNPVQARIIAAETGARIVEAHEIYDQPVSIFAPCAMGACLNDDTAYRLKCSIVAGAANNQLERMAIAKILQGRGILYAPDYVINAGGVMNILSEIENKPYDREEMTMRLLNIGERLQEIFRRAEATKQTTATIADEMAEQILARSRAEKQEKGLALSA